MCGCLIVQMCSLWKSWVWVCWLVWRRCWRNSGAGGTSLKPTSVCSETSPFRSGCAPRASSTTTTRKTNLHTIYVQSHDSRHAGPIGSQWVRPSQESYMEVFFCFFLVLYVIVVCILFHEGAVVLTQPAPAEWHWALPAAVNRRSLQQWLFERCSTHSVSAMLQRVPQHSHTHTKSTNQSLLEKYFHFMDILAIRYTVVVMLRRFLLCLFYYVWHLGLLLWVNEKSNGLSHCRWCLKSF